MSFMKFPAPLLAVAMLFVAGCQTSSPAPAVPLKNVSVNFEHPDRYTDVRQYFGGGPDEQYLDLLRQHTQETASQFLQPGQTLAVTFHDIDLAGEIFPTHTGAENVRVMKEIYAPRMELTFQLRDASGVLLREGHRQLRDMNFMNDLGRFGRNEPLGSDKAMLTRWLDDELKP